MGSVVTGSSPVSPKKADGYWLLAPCSPGGSCLPSIITDRVLRNSELVDPNLGARVNPEYPHLVIGPDVRRTSPRIQRPGLGDPVDDPVLGDVERVEIVGLGKAQVLENEHTRHIHDARGDVDA